MAIEFPTNEDMWSDSEGSTLLVNDQTAQLERGAQCLPVAENLGEMVGEPTNGAEYLAMIQ